MARIMIEYPFPGDVKYETFYTSDLRDLPGSAYHVITDDGVLHEDEGEIVDGKWKQKLVPSNRREKLKVLAYDEADEEFWYAITFIDGRVIAIVKIKD